MTPQAWLHALTPTAHLFRVGVVVWLLALVVAWVLTAGGARRRG